MGLIAPVTLVGALVLRYGVDVLTGITMAQVVRPGAPVLFGGAPATFHMKAASSPMAAIEAQRLNVAYVQIAKSLNLPTQAYMALSDGKFLDAQGGGSDLQQRLAGRDRRGELGIRARHARLCAHLQPAETRARQRGLRPSPSLPAERSAFSTTCQRSTWSTSSWPRIT